jgi:hypothetical protein
MKKTALILVMLTGIFYACKKEDKTTEPTPVTPVTPICTTCPYCVKDSVLADTLIHFKATIDDSVSFVASTLWDTVIGTYPNPNCLVILKGKNTFVLGSPELTVYYKLGNGANSNIGDSTTTAYMAYKYNNVVYHSKKGLIKLNSLTLSTSPYHPDKFSGNFCFSTDTINGVSHKIKLGSFKVKHP